MQENIQKKNYFLKLIAVLLVIITILLFFSRIGKINDYPVPTGNVDVFDIDVDVDYADVSDNNDNIGYTDVIDKNNNYANYAYATDENNVNSDVADNNSKVAKEESSKNNEDIKRKIPEYNEDTDSKTLGRVFVDDKNGNYIYQQNLKIFNNSAYNYTNKIAPGVSNTYHFVVHNSSNMNLKYYVEMYEESEYQVNLRYRLKTNNNYVVGNDNTWVTANELKTAFKNISDSSSDSYSLDWKWVDNDNKSDTIAGENMTSLYKLNIRFYFEEVDA